MIRILLLCLALTACGGSSPISPAAAQTVGTGTIQFEWTQHRHAKEGLWHGNPDIHACGWAGTAATAQTNTIYFGGMRPIQLARWLVVMNPASGGGARLIAYDESYVIQVLAELHDSRNSPIVTGAYVTADLNAFIASGAHHKFVGVQVCGPAVVYLSTIEVVY